jgi:hypothetical protein
LYLLSIGHMAIWTSLKEKLFMSTFLKPLKQNTLENLQNREIPKGKSKSTLYQPVELTTYTILRCAPPDFQGKVERVLFNWLVT